MGHSFAEMSSGRMEARVCPNCGQSREVPVESFGHHTENDCIRFLRKRVEDLEELLNRAAKAADLLAEKAGL
jgi:hypothetical protein